MSGFGFKQIDKGGSEILDVISKADKFNSWMYETIRPFCKGTILEIGSGIGNISQFFLNDGSRIFLTDIREVYCDKLKDKFHGSSNLLGVGVIDLVDPEFDIKYHDHLEKYDSVFALNVVEHIHDDQLAISNAKKLLRKNGNLIILVPSFQILFNGFDKTLEHYRRYTIKSLSFLFVKNNFKIIHNQYFNLMGILGWFVSGSILRNKSIPEGQMGLYNLLVPIFKLMDRLTVNAVGLSSIVVGQKQL